MEPNKRAPILPLFCQLCERSAAQQVKHHECIRYGHLNGFGHVSAWGLGHAPLDNGISLKRVSVTHISILSNLDSYKIPIDFRAHLRSRVVVLNSLTNLTHRKCFRHCYFICFPIFLIHYRAQFYFQGLL